MRYISSIALVTVVLLAAGCASTMAQPPADSPTDPPVDSPTDTPSDSSAAVVRLDNPSPPDTENLIVGTFETREGRMAAQPLDWDVMRGEVSPEAVGSLELSASPPGPPGSSPQGEPNPAADEDARSLYPQEWEGMAETFLAPDRVDFGTQDVFTQYCENCSGLNLNYPQRATGKLFTSGGTCSASVVSGQNVIVTAAHCCYNRGAGNWIGGWSFAPAYRDGFSPYGNFDWSSAIILNRWINVGDRRSDVCLIKLRNDSSGRGVTHYTGWLGRSWNFGTTQVHHSLGYPGNIGGGNKLEVCVSESFNPSASCGGATVLNTGCSMTYGASGGPWVRHWRGGNWVNSVVSGYDGGSCTGSFGGTYNGPRFTSDNIVTLCNGIGC